MTGFDILTDCKDSMRLCCFETLASQFGDRLSPLPNLLHIASNLCRYLVVCVLGQRRVKRCEHGAFPALDLWHIPPRDRRSGMRGMRGMRGMLFPDLALVLLHLKSLPTTQGCPWRSIARLFWLNGRNLAVGRLLGKFAA